MNEINQQEDFQAFSLPNAISYPFVKFSYFYGVPENDPIFKKIYFQNTKRYEFHSDFLQENIARYKKLTDYECIILPPKDDEGCASMKEATAGAIYHRPASSGEGEV